MILGNLIGDRQSALIMFFGIRVVPDDLMWLRYTCFMIFYALYMIGYTFQTACTRSGQTCLTNDPESAAHVHDFQCGSKPGGNGIVQFRLRSSWRDAGEYNSQRLL